MKNRLKLYVVMTWALCAAVSGNAETASEASSKASGDVSLQGVVTARAILSDSRGIFFLQDESGGVGIVMEGNQKDLPKNGSEIKLAATATEKSFLNYKSMELVTTNGTLPKLSVIRNASDEAALTEATGKYAVIPKVTFDGTQFKGGEMIHILANDKKFETVTSQSLNGMEVPGAEFNFFGVITKDDILGGDGSKTILIPSRIVPTSATETRKFATNQTCFTCHLLDKKLVGPAYLWVADKYKNDADAVPKIIEQIENGGMGKWGPIPMIGFKGRLDTAQMTELATWILDMRWEILLNE